MAVSRNTPASAMARASIMVEVDDEAEVRLMEDWLERHEQDLQSVTNIGCGCCIIGYDIEGPAAVIATLPERWRAQTA